MPIVNASEAHRYLVVDVFTRKSLEGNALAVFPQASGMDDGLMQRIARELNLAETAFVLPATHSDCTVGVRIFTPKREMVFAGHPTIGTAFVLLEEGIVPRREEHFVLEEKIGPVPIRVEWSEAERPLIWLRTPRIEYGRVYDHRVCAEGLGIEPNDLMAIAPQLLSAGNPTIFVPVKDKDTVDRTSMDIRGLRMIKGVDQEPVCVFVFTPTGDGAYSRMFGPEYGVPEDPATGSSTGPLAAFMMRHGLVAGAPGNRFISEQGTKMGRRSILHVHVVGQNGADGIEVGGYVTPVAEAVMRLRRGE
jgi:trans-2,3-dihydro-3-hydroxyanthranilate isomerase